MWRKNAAERVVDQGQCDRQEKGHTSRSGSTIGNQCSCESIARAGKKRLNGLALQRSQFPRCDLWVMPLVTYTKGWELMEASSFSSFLPVQVINQTPPKPSNFLRGSQDWCATKLWINASGWEHVQCCQASLKMVLGASISIVVWGKRGSTLVY